MTVVIPSARTDSVSVLHRGLLLGLAMLRRSFDSYGERFHIAYGVAMRAHRCGASKLALESYDPAFGVYRDAEEMILEGMRDCILVLESPRNVRATFKINVRTAGEELAQMRDRDGYREMSLAMHEALKR